MAQIIKLALLFLLTGWMIRQFRKPSGWLGRRIVNAMSLSHATMTDWGLRQVTVETNAVILDIGCGGGSAVNKLAALAPQGKIFGLDLSDASVVVARERNAREIEGGQVQIAQGSVASLPFSDCTFDLVTAIETHYYWPDLPSCVQGIKRALKPGGSFVIIAETYRGGPLFLLYSLVMPLLGAAFLSDQEHRDLLTQAGFIDVTTKHLRGKNWIFATGRKPMGTPQN